MNQGVLATLAVVGLTGCMRLVDSSEQYRRDGPVADASQHLDGAPPDHPRPPADGPSLDQSIKPEASVADVVAVADKPHIKDKGGNQDMKPPGDTSMNVPDLGLTPYPCAPSAQAVKIGNNAWSCTHPTLLYNQCDAVYLCNKGSHKLCTASQYKARVKSGVVATGWIAGCIRQGTTVIAPTDKICGPCINFSVSNLIVEWLCPPSNLGSKSSLAHVGIVSSLYCRRVGVDQTHAEGFWRSRSVDIKLPSAICCK